MQVNNKKPCLTLTIYWLRGAMMTSCLLIHPSCSIISWYIIWVVSRTSWYLSKVYHLTFLSWQRQEKTHVFVLKAGPTILRWRFQSSPPPEATLGPHNLWLKNCYATITEVRRSILRFHSHILRLHKASLDFVTKDLTHDIKRTSIKTWFANEQRNRRNYIVRVVEIGWAANISQLCQNIETNTYLFRAHPIAKWYPESVKEYVAKQPQTLIMEIPKAWSLVFAHRTEM